jgi:PRTRC genetic system protein B
MSGPVKTTITTAERPTWQLSRAVLVYLGERGGAYATLHSVETNGRDHRLASGVPATREACADLARALGATSTLCGFVPPNLLYLGAKSLVWWRPPGRARIFFDTTKDAAGDQADDKSGAALIGKRNGVVPHPGLVFAVSGGRWYVYAAKGAERPGRSSALLRAPYFNVWASGEICSGNVRLPDTLSTDALERYERAFFDSEFTHPNARGREKLIHYSSGAYGFWRDMLKAYAASDFPVQHLVELKLTLQGLVKRLEKGDLDGDD